MANQLINMVFACGLPDEVFPLAPEPVPRSEPAVAAGVTDTLHDVDWSAEFSDARLLSVGIHGP